MEQSPYKFIVVPDTNILFNKKGDIGNFFNRRCEEFINKYSPSYSLEIRLPEVVFGEIAYRKHQQLVKAIEAYNESISIIMAVSKDDVPEGKVSVSDAKSKIENVLFADIKRFNNINIEITPFEKISLKRLMTSSIWRIPPFEEKGEKGFRDSLIIETLLHIAEDKYYADVAFISNDEKLREAIDTRPKFQKNISLFSSLENYENYLKATNDYPVEFIRRATTNAGKVFFKEGDADCIWEKEGLENRILVRFNLHDKTEHIGNVFNVNRLLRYRQWSLSPQYLFDIKSTWFNGVIKKDIFCWTSEVAFTGIYTQKPVGVAAGLLGVDAESKSKKMMYSQRFYVEWSSKVTESLEFSEINVSEISEGPSDIEYET